MKGLLRKDLALVAVNAKTYLVVLFFVAVWMFTTVKGGEISYFGCIYMIVVFGFVSCGAVFFFIPALGRDSSRRLTKTVMNAVIASSVIAIAQLVTLLIQSGDPIGAVASKYSLNAGYAHPNYLANIIARSIPVAIWLSVSNKRYSFLWLFFAYICGVSILLTSSRATLLVAVIVSIVCVIYYFPKLDYKLNWICTFCILLGITMTGAGLLSDKLSALFPNIFKGLNSNGRIDLWNLGIERFLKDWETVPKN